MTRALPAIIPSVWTSSQRDLATLSPWPLVHVAGGGLRTIQEFVQPLREAQKQLWIHPDMIAGLAKDREGLEILQDLIAPTAIVTSNLTLAHIARQMRAPLVLRVFVHDTQSLNSSLAAIERIKPDILCCLPAVVYPLIRQEISRYGLPVVAAGVIRTASTRDYLTDLGVSVEIGQPSLW